MPFVEVSMPITAPPDVAWASVIDIETYPDRMSNVQSVQILEYLDSRRRRVAWSVVLRGSILRWVDQEDLDEANRLITFKQEDGDLERFDGQWIVSPGADGGSLVTLRVDFEIGIPLLAAMLHPIAEAALRDNAKSMLEALDTKASEARVGEPKGGCP